MNDTERLTAVTRLYTTEELYAKGYADGYENGRMSKEPVFFPPCEDCNKKMDEIRKAYDHRKAQISDTISELENIKTRIDEEVVYVTKWQVKNDSIQIINERISELKGENNE